MLDRSDLLRGVNAIRTWILLPVMLIGLSLPLSGCKKDELEPPPPLLDDSGAIMNRKCPMCGTWVDHTIVTQYDGKKVYLCSDGCKRVFDSAPQNYLRTLPQFGGNEN